MLSSSALSRLGSGITPATLFTTAGLEDEDEDGDTGLRLLLPRGAARLLLAPTSASSILSPAPGKVLFLALLAFFFVVLCPGFMSMTETLGLARGWLGSPWTMMGSQWPALSL